MIVGCKILSTLPQSIVSFVALPNRRVFFDKAFPICSMYIISIYICIQLIYIFTYFGSFIR